MHVSATVFRSQYGEDRWLWENGLDRRDGMFVDVGAGLPVHGSNTWAFEQIGWRGLLIDADERNVGRLVQERKVPSLHAAIGAAAASTVALHRHRDSTLSAVRPKAGIEYADAVAVPGFTLQVVLDRFGIGPIDLLSVDVEGAELEVLGSFALERHQPEVIIVEHLTRGEPSAEAAILEWFGSRPYVPLHRTRANWIFRRRRS